MCCVSELCDVWCVCLIDASLEHVHHHHMYVRTYVQEELSAAVDESTGQFERELTM